MSKLKISPFLDQSRWLSQNDYAFSVRDNFPVSEGHTLIVPKALVSSVFELSDTEIAACWKLLRQEREKLVKMFSPSGFNVGVNDGESAGQTVPHAHIHLIPRYLGDHPNPRGGVRGIIPGKADY